MYSFIVFKYVNRKIHFRENWLIFLGIWGETELILRMWGGSKGKILSGSCGIFFQGFGEINALFSGIHGAQTPPGGLIRAFAGPLNILSVKLLTEHHWTF